MHGAEGGQKKFATATTGINVDLHIEHFGTEIVESPRRDVERALPMDEIHGLHISLKQVAKLGASSGSDACVVIAIIV